MVDSLVDNRCDKAQMINVEGEPVKVTVGEADKMRCFHVHESLVRSRSLFFEAALGKSWKEGQDRAVTLPEVCMSCLRGSDFELV